MGLEEKLPSGFLLTTAEKAARYARAPGLAFRPGLLRDGGDRW
jgi:hypothetical protein